MPAAFRDCANAREPGVRPVEKDPRYPSMLKSSMIQGNRGRLPERLFVVCREFPEMIKSITERGYFPLLSGLQAPGVASSLVTIFDVLRMILRGFVLGRSSGRLIHRTAAGMASLVCHKATGTLTRMTRNAS